MIYSIHKTVLMFTLLLVTISCDNTKEIAQKQNPNYTACENYKKGKIINMTGLDGCGWMIELANGEKLNPTNLNDFNIKMSPAKQVNLNYIEKNDMAGICMAGKIVEITCITEAAK